MDCGCLSSTLPSLLSSGATCLMENRATSVSPGGPLDFSPSHPRHDHPQGLESLPSKSLWNPSASPHPHSHRPTEATVFSLSDDCSALPRTIHLPHSCRGPPPKHSSLLAENPLLVSQVRWCPDSAHKLAPPAHQPHQPHPSPVQVLPSSPPNHLHFLKYSLLPPTSTCTHCPFHPESRSSANDPLPVLLSQAVSSLGTGLGFIRFLSPGAQHTP